VPRHPGLGSLTVRLRTIGIRILNIFPSVDAGTCAASVRKFNELAAKLDNSVVLCVFADLPFAQARFCGAEGLDDVVTLSTLRHGDLLTTYGVAIASGPRRRRSRREQHHSPRSTRSRDRR
jgi:thiol peroxidase